MGTYKATPENVRILGRAYYANDLLWLGMSLSGVEFIAGAGKLAVTFRGMERWAEDSHPRLAIFADGERLCDGVMDSGRMTLETELYKESVVRIIKISECHHSTAAIEAISCDGEIRPTTEKKRFISFIGDSITNGFGVDDTIKENLFNTRTEDATRAYASLTAEALNADIELFAMSGWGIISGWTDGITCVSAEIVPPYYTTYGFSDDTFGGAVPQDIQWSFSRKPDVIVINLGTNDDSYCLDHSDRQEFFRGEYVKFLKKVRDNNPSVKIICSFGIMGDRLYPVIQSAVTEHITSTGDNNISTFLFPVQLEEDGFGACWHPSPVTHAKEAKQLIPEIQSLMKW